MRVQHYQFNSHQCATSETVAEYVAALLKLAKHCNFGNTLDEMLRDRLVCGIAKEKCLFTEPKLTFTKAVTIAQAVKGAEKCSRELQSVRDPLKTFTSFTSNKFQEIFTQIGRCLQGQTIYRKLVPLWWQA